MTSTGKSRWADEEGDAAAAKARKLEKEAKKRAKAEKVRRQQEAEQRRLANHNSAQDADQDDDSQRPAKRRRITPEPGATSKERASTSATIQAHPRPLLHPPAPSWGPCRSVANFERLNHIEEGSYGWVSRAREKATGEVVALKKLKMDGAETNGFPVTGLREIQCLMEIKQQHVVELREVVIAEDESDDSVYLVMEFLEHDLKTLQEDMQEPFLPSEIKTLMLQLCSAVEYLHDHWILHRDLKTSNILMNNRGTIKLADFGMARHYGSPSPPLTQLVVTLWYRAPELLLGASTYGPAVDLWSCGCIFGELLTKEPLLQGKNEVDQLTKTFALAGIPTEATWPGFKRLPNAKSLRLPPQDRALNAAAAAAAGIRARFPLLTASGASLLAGLLTLDPSKRPSARDVLAHAYFIEDPRPKKTAMFPTFPSKAGQEKRRRVASPSAPKRGQAPGLGDGADLSGVGIFGGREGEEAGAGFRLKLV